MKNILMLSGCARNFQNVGDCAQLRCELEQLVSANVQLIVSEEAMLDAIRAISYWQLNANIELISLEQVLLSKEHFASRANAFYVCGGGWLTDWFEEQTQHTISWGNEFIARGKPCYASGIGLGPWREPEVSDSFAKLKATLSKFRQIGLREKQNKYADLMGLNWSYSGDSAEPIVSRYGALYDEETPSAIGLNLKQANYANKYADYLALAKALANANLLDSQFVNLPISFANYSNFASPDQLVAKEFADANSLALAMPSYKPWQTEAMLANLVNCKLMITVSYHSAYFALMLNRPAICLVGNTYYWHKMLALQDIFGDKLCRVVDVRDAEAISEALAK